MKKSHISLVKKQYSDRQPLFLNDPNADVYALLGQKIYPLHIKFLKEVDLFAKSDLQSTKIVIIDAPLDNVSFQNVIGYFYGKQLQFSRNWDIIKILNTVVYLKANCLFKIIIKDVQNYTDQYGFFLLVSIAQKYKIKWLQENCEQDLILMGFQQLNFNRSDLMRLEKPLLENLIRQHQLYRINQNIVGLKEVQFKRIIKEYCATNGLPDSQYNNLCSNLLYQIRQKMQKQGSLVKKPSMTQSQTKESTKLISSSTDYKEDELNKLRLINSELQTKGAKMIQQIKTVKNQLDSSTKIQKNEMQHINQNLIQERFKKWEKVCQEQDARFLTLKTEVQKLNNQSGKKSQNDKSQKSTGNGMNGSTNSTKDEQTFNQRSRRSSETVGNLIPFMPVLSKDLD